MLLAAASWSQDVALPRAKSALTLLDFEATDSLSGWKGLPCTLTDSHASAGAHAMSFTFPKYIPGGEKWPQIGLESNGPAGYKIKDWSHYAKMVFDVWTDSSKTSDLALELDDLSSKNGWAHHYNIKPGIKNTIEVDLADTRGSLDLNNVRKIVLFTSVPESSFTITVDNFRLLPGNKPSLADYDIIYPNYRNRIFPDAKLIKISVTLHPEEYGVKVSDMAVKLTATGGEERVSTKVSFKSPRAILSLPAASLPAGPVTLTACITGRNGRVVTQTSQALRKLTKKEVRSLSVYVDENNNTIVDGKPFFPIGWYDSMNPPYGSPDHIDEIAKGPFNCILDYSTNRLSKSDMLSFLDRVQAKGMKLIYCMNDLHPEATDFRSSSWEGIKGNEKIASAVISAYKNHPAILAWYLNDELPKSMEPGLAGYYRRVASADPNHPCFIVLCTMPEVKYFPETTDIMGVDPYPVPESPVTKVSEAADTARLAVDGHKPTWMALQAFAWYQHHSDNPDRGHIPTEAELKTGRAPSYEESRCMTYLALTHGAKGLIYWCYYDMKQLPQYNEMWAGMKKIGGEVKSLSPVLLSSDDLREVKCSSPEIHTKLKIFHGELYLIAVNAGLTQRNVTFDLGRKISPTATEIFEKRNLRNGRSTLTDSFKPLEAHVYRIAE